MLSRSASSRSSQRSCRGPSQLGLGLLRKWKIEVCVAPPYRLAVAALGQAFERVFADRLEHAEPRLVPSGALSPEQVVFSERVHARDDVELDVPGSRPFRHASSGEAPDRRRRGS